MAEGLAIEPGVEVIVSERRYKITQVLDLERVLVRDVATGEAKQFRLIELRSFPKKILPARQAESECPIWVEADCAPIWPQPPASPF